MRIALWVHPRSARASVGGSRQGALVVRVVAAPEDGKATEEALRSVAKALGVRRGQVTLLSGSSSRAKVVHVEAGKPGGDPGLAARVESLQATP